MTEIMKLEDLDPIETREWIESIDSILKTQGAERAHFLLEQLIDYTRRSGAYLPFRPNTAYLNTITPGQEPSYPGSREFERRIEAYIRWNALAMVLLGHLVRSRLQSFLACEIRSASRRHGVRPGTRLARHLCACLSRRAALGKPAEAFPPGSLGRRAVVLSASLADA